MPGGMLYHQLVFGDVGAALFWVRRLIGALDWTPEERATGAGAAAWLGTRAALAAEEGVVYASLHALTIAQVRDLGAISEGAVPFAELPSGLAMIGGDHATWSAYQRRGRPHAGRRGSGRTPRATRAEQTGTSGGRLRDAGPRTH